MEDEVFDEHMTGQSPDYDDGDNMIMTNGEKKIIITDKPAKTVKGRNFAYEINGLQIFAMGADYIPEDNILTRQTRERTDLLLKSAQEANLTPCVYGEADTSSMTFSMMSAMREDF